MLKTKSYRSGTTKIGWLLLLVLTTTFRFANGNRLQVVIVSGDVRILSTRVQVRPLDLLEKSETVVISPGSYLLLIDHAANIYEFRGSTSVLLDTLNGRSLQASALVDLELLYRKERRMVQALDDSKCIVIEGPFYFSTEMVLQGSVTVSWLHLMKDSKKFLVVVENEFGDRIFKKSTSAHRFTFASDSVNPSPKNLFIQVRTHPKSRHCNTPYRKIVIQETTFNDTRMDSHSAGASVMKGFSLSSLAYLR